MNYELKPCPFCGSEAVEGGGFALCSNVDCNSCGVYVEDWNTRPIEDEWKAAHDNLARQLSVANDNLEVAVDGLMWMRDLFVENGEYNEATEKVNEILKRLEG